MFSSRLQVIRRFVSYSTKVSGNGSYSRWTSTRVVLFSSAIATFTYFIGASNVRSELGMTLSTLPLPRKDHVYGGRRELVRAMKELVLVLGKEGVSDDEEDLERHGLNEWSCVDVDTFPALIVYPRSTQDVAAIAKISHKYRVPVVAYAGGTSLEGHFASTPAGICCDFTLMDGIIAVREDDLDCTVQCGVNYLELNKTLKEKGLFFPPDPAPTARIGGMIGTGCSGTNASRYGTMKDWVLNLTVVLADGTIIKTRRRARKSCAGYDLTRLFVGSEGTLGLVTEATLKLTTLPDETVAVCSFPTIRDAAMAVAKVTRSQVQCAAVEMMDQASMKIINHTNATKRKWEEKPTLFIKFSGTPGQVAEQISQVREITNANKGGKFEFASDEEEALNLWSARKALLWSLISMSTTGSEVWTTDICTPISAMPKVIEECQRDLDASGFKYGIVSHACDGNWHAAIHYNKNNPGERELVENIVHKMVDRAIDMDGTCTGEHGVGLGKRGELGQETVDTMRRIKYALDPLGLLNPHKVIPDNYK
ncbi:D-lactate dehydrogenase [cytochrome], mitochondrial [Neolecta irregularis DAH-3]|uniref:D-lactate dehydrogenase (cytochrome) n=1 Tax=Neolecta irregularis (strain DAH-3) TaxID=1198029 RepID=A0A1U7LHP7_NEOID|nr:D-lactate dehydrogenase [cytochrome], mitochondrial [Neolecta irregularis DAH-3]|eukprot:OLL22169.1 D-lactate dehydrogenase [cytochrome], mitochondrial [Neolecta irregularis DAH-3]